jgi:hypothetical protein
MGPVLDPAACYRALRARDARFDGRFYVAVLSTGVFCRPVCPARTPRPEHCAFFPSAAAAHAAGFRPCLRCRPELAPGVAGWRGTANTVSRALALIAEGAWTWTATVIAMRAFHEPDAFPESDLGLLRALERRGARPRPADLLRRAEAWRPWRAYAALHLWAGDPGGAGDRKTPNRRSAA